MPSRTHITHTVGLKIRRHLGMLVWVGENDREEEGWKTRVERDSLTKNTAVVPWYCDGIRCYFFHYLQRRLDQMITSGDITLKDIIYFDSPV